MIDYIYIITFIIIATCFSIGFSAIPFVIVQRRVTIDKHSQYECGFNDFDSAQSKFNIHFYLVALLFLIMDLEILFFFPGSISLCEMTLYNYFTVIIFLIILTIGFGYEWSKGALN